MKDVRPRKVRPATLVVDLKTLKEPWSAWCAARGITSSEAVRVVLGQVVQGKAPRDVSQPSSNLAPTENHGRTRVEIRLSLVERAALEDIARKEGMSVNRFFQALVRVRLAGRDQFGANEIAALNHSTQTLVKLGQNINQIRNQMGARPDADGLTLAQIDHVQESISAHKVHVEDLLRANRRRWRP